ncbi:hypothetical protein EAH80_07850 [Mycobacterium hodleri]|uniref:Uncharacterized protein n=2 Tax=Mycolicibacterium hodleri TaxID=49897 RepID=A0A502EGE6_9MYCO|nr:hypothetical protein EAH80_07850 [Mycolicibacterium hodleri]
MKITFEYVTSALAAIAIGGAVALAPIASAETPPTPLLSAETPAAIGGAGTDPLVPFGTNPEVPRLGYVDSSHDDANTTSGEVDLPF